MDLWAHGILLYPALQLFFGPVTDATALNDPSL